jgi:hypothetical protein
VETLLREDLCRRVKDLVSACVDELLLDRIGHMLPL